MRRRERRLATTEGRTPRTLTETDYLLQVDDEARLGALRFRESVDGPFLREAVEGRIPPLVDVGRLLAAADRVADDRDTIDDLKLLLAPGSSLGGARPKASVRDRDGALAIAKFPHRDDDWDAVMAVHLRGHFCLSRHAAGHWREQVKAGVDVKAAIVNTSSGAGLIGFPGMCPYVAAKHGVIGLTKTAALEFGAQGVRINAICPGTARTRMVEIGRAHV